MNIRKNFSNVWFLLRVLFLRAKMTKKDRIAIAVSVIYSFLTIVVMLVFVAGGWTVDAILTLGLLLPVFLYWGYRFIKNDLSFIE